MNEEQATQVIQRIQTQQDLIQQLQIRLEHQEQLQQAAEQQQPAAAPTFRNIKFPDPGRFDGKNVWTYQQWKQKVVAKLTADFDRLGDPQQQAWYIFSMLDSPASDRAAPWMSSRQQAVTPESFLEYLDGYYLDPTHHEKASQKLFNLRQGRQSLTSFLTHFDQLLLESGGASWPDQSKMPLLRNAVDPSLLAFLVSRSPPSDYEDLKKALRDIDNNRSLFLRNTNAKGVIQPFHQTFDSPLSQPRAAIEPMDLDAMGNSTRQRATWASSEEISRRKEDGRCLRCGALRHQIKSCPLFPARRPRTDQTGNVGESSSPLKD